MSSATLHLRVSMPPLYSIRMSIASWLIQLAGRVADGIISIEIVEDDEPDHEPIGI